MLMWFYYEPGKYFGLDIDVYDISGTSKSGLNALRSEFNSIIFDLYFYLGAKQLNETPEQIISCCRISKIDLNTAQIFPCQQFGIPVIDQNELINKMMNNNHDAYIPNYNGLLWLSLRYDIEFRKFSILQCLVGIIDLLVLLISCISITSLLRLPTYIRSFILLCDLNNKHCLYKCTEKTHKQFALSGKSRIYIYRSLIFNIFASIFDIILFLPFILISIISIIRIPTIYALFKRHIKSDDIYNKHNILMRYNMQIRIEITKCAFLAICDWFIFIITLPSILRFGAWSRCIGALQNLWKSTKLKDDESTPKAIDISTHFIVYKALLLNIPCCILMYITLLIMIIDILFVFRAYHTIQAFYDLNKKDEIKYTKTYYIQEGDTINWSKLNIGGLLRWSWSFRIKIIQNLLLSILDIFVMIIAIPGLPRLLICSRRSPRFASKQNNPDNESDSDSDSDLDLNDEEKQRKQSKSNKVREKATDLYHWFGWFFIENLDNYKADKYWYCRKALIINTFLTFIDIFIVLPFALPTFILRGRFVLNSFKSQSYKFKEKQDIPYNFQSGQAMPNKKTSKRSYKTLKVLDYDIELRVFLMINFLISIFDLIIILLTIPSILMPTRSMAYFHILYKYYWRDQGGHLNQMRKLLFLNLFLAVFDLINILPLIYNLILPTRYAHIIRSLDFECIKKRKLKQLQQHDQQNLAQMPDIQQPNVPVLDDDVVRDVVDYDMDQQQLQNQQNEIPLLQSTDHDGDGVGDGDGVDDGDGKQQITYSSPSIPSPPKHANNNNNGMVEEENEYKENVELQIESVQQTQLQQNEGGSGIVNNNNNNDNIPLRTDGESVAEELNDNNNNNEYIPPSAPLINNNDDGDEDENKESIPLNTHYEIQNNENEEILPSAPNAPIIPPMAFEERHIIQEPENNDDEKQDTLELNEQIARNNKFNIDNEYQETLQNETAENENENINIQINNDQDIQNVDDDNNVLLDGETPGLSIPNAVIIPVPNSDDEHDQNENENENENKNDDDIDRLNKDEEEIEKFEAQKAALIMEALPGQSEEQFMWKELRFNMEFRKELWRSSYHGSMDDVALFFAFLSIICSLGIRIKQFKQCTYKYLPNYYTNQYHEWRYGCFYNFLYAIYDIIFLIGVLITILCIVRIIPLYDQCKYDQSRIETFGVSRYTNWCKYAWRNDISSPIDLLFLPFVIIVILSPHIIDIYKQYESVRNEYIKHSKLIVEFDNNYKQKQKLHNIKVEMVANDGKIILNEGEGTFRITYSSLDIITMMKVRLLIFKHALHWIFIDILILFPMFIFTFIYWLVIWPTLKYVIMSQWKSFKQMVRGGFLCCLKSLKCWNDKEEEPLHDGPSDIVQENAIPSAPQNDDAQNPEIEQDQDQDLKYDDDAINVNNNINNNLNENINLNVNDEEKQGKRPKIERKLETAGKKYYS